MEASPFLCSCRGPYWKRAFSQLELRSSEVPLWASSAELQETTKPQCKTKRGSTRGCAGASLSARCGAEGCRGKASPPALAGFPRSVGSVLCWGICYRCGMGMGRCCCCCRQRIRDCSSPRVEVEWDGAVVPEPVRDRPVWAGVMPGEPLPSASAADLPVASASRDGAAVIRPHQKVQSRPAKPSLVLEGCYWKAVLC